MDALLTVIIVAAAVSAACWLLSLFTGDHSWVDRIWSLVPIAYLWIFAGYGNFDPRLVLMAVLVTLWGARLTANFARKGGYTGMEDYRWAILRGRMSRWQFELFNLFFIVGYQNALLVLITLPALTVLQNPGTPLGFADGLLAALFLGLLAGETIADGQQWNFHRAKAAQIAAGKQPSARFATEGLWRFSRHPNFFFEQAQWWALFLFGALAAGSVLQWTVLGAVLLTGLFIGSTIFTESITRSKYPEYADYQRRTSMLIPLPPRKAQPAIANN